MCSITLSLQRRRLIRYIRIASMIGLHKENRTSALQLLTSTHIIAQFVVKGSGVKIANAPGSQQQWPRDHHPSLLERGFRHFVRKQTRRRR